MTGAEGARLHAVKGDHETTFHRPHPENEVGKRDLLKLVRFLEEAEDSMVLRISREARQHRRRRAYAGVD